MKLLRTPEERFANLPGYPFEPNYVEVPSGEGDTIRIHYVDEGPKDASPVLLMHGEPSWSYLYRKMIPIIVNAGYRAVAPDLVGFGRSDKPSDRNDYTYQRHVDWMKAWLEAVHLREITQSLYRICRTMPCIDNRCGQTAFSGSAAKARRTWTPTPWSANGRTTWPAPRRARYLSPSTR